MNLEPRVSCASHNSLPRAKDGKRQKRLELDVQAIFSQSLRVQQVAPTVSPVGSVGASALCAEVSTGDPHPLQRRQKGLFNSGVLEKRELFGERRKEWSVYYEFYKIYSNTEFLSTRRALATLSTVYNPDTIKCRGYLFYLVLTLLTFDQEE